MTVTIYHNPRCSKSRQTLQLLEDRGIELETVLYLETPPGVEQLGRILDLLNMEPRELMRKSEAAYEENNLDNDGLSRDQLISAMVRNPILIERPIVMAGDRARIGRPPESVLDIIDG